MKIGDWLIVAAAIAVSVVFTSAAAGRAGQSGFLEIESAGEAYLYSLAEDQTIDVEGPIGTTHIEIAGGHAHVTDSPCRDKLCIAAGWISTGGEWTACLPNRVFLSVRGAPDAGEPDAVAR